MSCHNSGRHVAVWLFGILQVLIGGGTVALGVWALVVRSYVGSWAAGIWAGGWVLATGLVGTCGCCCRGAEIGFLGLNILASAGLWIALLLISLYGAFMDANNSCSDSYTWAAYLYDLQAGRSTNSNQFCPTNRSGLVVNVILVFVSLLLLVLAVISSLLGCLAVCCSPQTVPSQVRRDAAKDVEEVRLVNSSEPLGIDDHHDKPKTKKFGWKKSLRVRPANPMPTVLNISSTNQQSAVPEPLQTAAELPVATRQLLPPLQTRNDIVTGKSADNEHSEPIDTVVDTSITEPQEIP